MSWPEYVWRPQDPNADDMGMVPFTPPVGTDITIGIDAGLPADWQDYDGRIESVNAWEAIDNPLYEAAAGALDINWEDFKTNFNETIGEQDLYVRPDAPDAEEPTPDTTGAIGVVAATTVEGGDTASPYDWGITNAGIESDLNEMQGWLLETVEEVESRDGYTGGGPNAKDWGYPEGNIWTILGLDQPPQGPQPLAEDMFTYKDSPDNYSVPEAYTEGNPWIEAGVWLGNNPNYAENRQFHDQTDPALWDYTKGEAKTQGQLSPSTKEPAQVHP